MTVTEEAVAVVKRVSGEAFLDKKFKKKNLL